MKNLAGFLVLLLFISTSCSTGKKALQKGEYFSAVSKAVDRLKSAPDNRNATKVLKEGYPMAIEWSQEEMDMIISNNVNFKWERAIQLMQQVNNLSREIRQIPAARKIIKNPKTYSSELNMAQEKAAEERYNAGINELDYNTKESAKIAFNHFQMADRFIPEYKNVHEKLEESKMLATINMILETIPVNTSNYKLSSEFFYNQVFNYLNNRFPKESFVNFYSPEEAENVGINNPDFIVAMHFFDFSVGNTAHREVEEQAKSRVKIESKDTTRIQYKNYEAKIKTFTDEVNSGGVLDIKIFEFAGNKLMQNDRIPGSFKWINDYAIYVGDIEALDKKQIELIQRKAVPLPPKQDLFIEFTKPIYDQLTVRMNNFFRRYN